MIFYKDPIMQLATFVLIGLIISTIVFNDNTKSPLVITEQPQHSLSSLSMEKFRD